MVFSSCLFVNFFPDDGAGLAAFKAAAAADAFVLIDHRRNVGYQSDGLHGTGIQTGHADRTAARDPVTNLFCHSFTSRYHLYSVFIIDPPASASKYRIDALIYTKLSYRS